MDLAAAFGRLRGAAGSAGRAVGFGTGRPDPGDGGKMACQLFGRRGGNVEATGVETVATLASRRPDGADLARWSAGPLSLARAAGRAAGQLSARRVGDRRVAGAAVVFGGVLAVGFWANETDTKAVKISMVKIFFMVRQI